MHMITGALSIIGVAIVGFIGNVLAHDFCERAPTLARWMLDVATKRLPAVDRKRYAEEWAAHLADCEGVCAKLRHAFGCLWCAHRMRRQTFKAMTLSVTFNLPTIGEAVVSTSLYEIGALLWLHGLFARTKAAHHAYFGALTLLFWRRVFVDAHKRSRVTGTQFAQFLRASKSDDWVPTAITLTIEGERIELIKVLRSLNNSLNAFIVKIAEVLKVGPKQIEKSQVDDWAAN